MVTILDLYHISSWLSLDALQATTWKENMAFKYTPMYVTHNEKGLN